MLNTQKPDVTQSALSSTNHSEQPSGQLPTHIEGHLKDILGDLHDARVSQLPRHTHPGVGGGHGVAQLLDGDDDDSVRDHCGGTQYVSSRAEK